MRLRAPFWAKAKVKCNAGKSQEYSTFMSQVRTRQRQSRADQCQRKAGEDVLSQAAELDGARVGPRQGEDRSEQSQGIVSTSAQAHFRPIFGVRLAGQRHDQSWKCHGRTRAAQGQAELGQVCFALERNGQSRTEA